MSFDVGGETTQRADAVTYLRGVEVELVNHSGDNETPCRLLVKDGQAWACLEGVPVLEEYGERLGEHAVIPGGHEVSPSDDGDVV